MISRVYTIDDGNEIRSYKGFDRNYETAELIALILDNGEPEFWAIDEGQQSNFFQFLITEYPHTIPGGLFRRLS